MIIVMLVGPILCQSCNYAFPTGIWFWYETAAADTSESVTASNFQIMHIVNKAGLFHILFGLIKF